MGKVNEKDLESFRKTILSMVPAAQKMAKAALKVRRKKKRKDGTDLPALQPKSVDFARWILEQYAKFAAPETDVHELHIIDHATLAQMKEAQSVMAEYEQRMQQRMNERLNRRINGGVEPN